MEARPSRQISDWDCSGGSGRFQPAYRKMEESVRKLHQTGRLLRLGAAGGFFRSGLFTDYLARLEISDKFRPCFLRVEPEMAGKSLLAAQCDVYFGIGLCASERLERIDLGMIGWKISRVGDGKGKLARSSKKLGRKWLLLCEGDRRGLRGTSGNDQEIRCDRRRNRGPCADSDTRRTGPL